jgi:hypothetical protein
MGLRVEQQTIRAEIGQFVHFDVQDAEQSARVLANEAENIDSLSVGLECASGRLADGHAPFFSQPVP